MDDLMDLDQIVDGEGWQLSMDSIGEYSNSSRLSLGAEALRVFEDEEVGWRTVGAHTNSTMPGSGSSSSGGSNSSSMQTPANSFCAFQRDDGDDDDDDGGSAGTAAGDHAPLPFPLGQRVFVNQGSMEGVPGNKSYGYFASVASHLGGSYGVTPISDGL